MQVRFRKLCDNAVLPVYKTPGSAGADLYATEGGKLWPGEQILVSTGLIPMVPEGYEIQVRPRSGLALQYGISVTNSPGTIDSDYRGEIGVILINLGHKVFTWESGDRIAQMVVSPVMHVEFVETDTIDETGRGAGGYGSTGK